MKISARNQFKATVENIQEGAVNAVVTLNLGTETIKANITMAAVEELGLAAGKSAVAVVKATNVMFAAGDKVPAISARNQFTGTIVKVERGAVNGHVTIECAGIKISGSITNEAIDALALAEGGQATAIIKSTDVMVGVE